MAVIGGLRVRSIDGVIVVGSLAFVLAQFGGYFGSYVYIAAIAPVLCTRVDDWLRMLLPELAHAYGEAPAFGRRLREAAAPAALQPAESSPPPQLSGAMDVIGRVRGPRTSRNVTG